MGERKRIDKILENVLNRIQEEIGALLGTDFSLSESEKELHWKESVFSQLKGKQICALMDIVGDVSGNGCLLIGIKDAIRLGGTLIMLPDAELDEVIGREEYSEEVEDSYGEIANIIAGAFTKDFEESYPKACRFIRKEQNVLVPSKVETESPDPVENQIYYVVSYQMELAGKELGNLMMLMPAETFEIELEGVIGGNDADLAEEADVAGESSAEEVGSDSTAESAEDAQVSSNFNVKKNKERVDQLLEECQQGLQDEIGGLLGVDVDLFELENRFTTKEEFFNEHVKGRQVIADMEVVGDLQGKSYFVSTLKDAIHLGGVLIMLPPNELENVVAEGEFGEDAEDAYGEIANIASGVYTRIFEERYTKKLRFIKKDINEVTAEKVDLQSDQPIEDQQYYLSTMSLTVEGKALDKIHMLIPLDLVQLQTFHDAEDETTADIEPPSAESPKEKTPKEQATDTQTVPKRQAVDPQAKKEAEKHRTRVDKLFGSCLEKMSEEVGSLLGVDFHLEDAGAMPITKEEFFGERVSGKQVVADMDVVGELEGRGYLSVDLRDAVRIGGVLIMLPTSELDSVVASESFGEDVADAYGEIANIIAGVYTGVFEEQYTKKIRFVRGEQKEVVASKVETGSAEPLPDGHYYLHSLEAQLGENKLGQINLLVPIDLFELSGLIEIEQTDVEEAEHAIGVPSQAPSATPSDTGRSIGGTEGPPDILLVGDDAAEASKIADVLFDQGHNVKILTFKDDIHNYLPGEVKAVYLVMRTVNEQAFGTAIKVSSVCSLPIIAAGPEWTRTKVIKAVKYGVADILLTPASDEDIEENLNNNLLLLAA